MKHVLVVDDALDLGRLLKTTLSLIDPSMPIVVVPSAEEALLEASRYPLDLLVTDIRLPGISGFDLIRKVRIKHPNVKIIMITGMTDDGVRQQIKEMKVDAFFYKPMDIPEFTEAARRCLELHIPKELEGVEVSPAKSTSFADKRISEALVEIRKRLDARTILLLDERGRVGAQAGEPVDSDFESEWSADLLITLSTAAKVSRHLHQTPPQNVLAFWGKKFNLIVAPVERYALVFIMETGRSKLRLALAFEEAVYAQQDLEKIMQGLNMKDEPLEVSHSRKEAQLDQETPARAPEVEDVPAEKEGDLENLAKLIQQSAQNLEVKDVEAFWDSQSTPNAALPEDAGIITYDQARKLGLVPSENE
jgi:DNA-binding response OmpR family regulator